MKRLLRKILFSICLVAMTAGTVFGWAWGTHTYIIENIGQDRLPAKSNEIYGSVAPDTFNLLFDDPPLMEALATATHVAAEDVWDLARNQPEREFAFGFASHNEMWGADMTAHQYGLTFGGPDFGYVIAKADLLLSGDLGEAFDNMGLPQAAADFMAHILVEDAIDLLIAGESPELGEHLMRAALHRNQLFPKLLVKTYGDLADKELIEETEAEFRSNMISYGQILQQDPAVAQQLMAALLVGQAKAYLAMFPEVTIPDDETLFFLADHGLTYAKGICSADYLAELGATIAYVKEQLESHGIQD